MSKKKFFINVFNGEYWAQLQDPNPQFDTMDQANAKILDILQDKGHNTPVRVRESQYGGVVLTNEELIGT